MEHSKMNWCAPFGMCTHVQWTHVTVFSGTNDTKVIFSLTVPKTDLKNLENTNENIRETLFQRKRNANTRAINSRNDSSAFAKFGFRSLSQPLNSVKWWKGIHSSIYRQNLESPSMVKVHSTKRIKLFFSIKQQNKHKFTIFTVY